MNSFPRFIGSSGTPTDRPQEQCVVELTTVPPSYGEYFINGGGPNIYFSPPAVLFFEYQRDGEILFSPPIAIVQNLVKINVPEVNTGTSVLARLHLEPGVSGTASISFEW